MTKQEANIISEALGEMEDAVNTLTGTERRQVCEMMQQISTLGRWGQLQSSMINQLPPGGLSRPLGWSREGRI